MDSFPIYKSETYRFDSRCQAFGRSGLFSAGYGWFVLVDLGKTRGGAALTTRQHAHLHVQITGDNKCGLKSVSK